MSAGKGICYLVGAGPGDPGLITVKGLACVRRAEVIYYDNLAAPVFLEHATEQVEKIYVGKRCGVPAARQEDICEQLCEAVGAGKIVVRLKGGDPFLFGRGGEEALALAAAGLPFEIVPGVTAAIAGGAYAGIPITHRGLAAVATLVTGHEDPLKPESHLHWDALAKGSQTLCFYMGTAHLQSICQRLIDNGRSPTELVAVIQKATTPDQRTVIGTLTTIAERVRDEKLQPPTLIIVGAVVALHEKISWYDQAPLLGKRILITRAREQASPLADAIRSRGGEPLYAPTFALAATECFYPPELLANLCLPALDTEVLQKILAACDPLTAAILHLRFDSNADWVIFTSANGVKFFWQRLAELGLDARIFARCRLAVVGKATAAALEKRGLRADFIPENFSGAQLASELIAFLAEKITGMRFVLFRSALATATLHTALRESGGVVEDIVAYTNTACTEFPPSVREALFAGEVAAVTFASASAVTNFCTLLGEDLATLLASTSLPKLVSIGARTSDSLRANNLPVAKEASESTIADLVRALETCLKDTNPVCS